MNPALAIAVVVALVAVTTVAGLVWRSRTGRVRVASGDPRRVTPADVSSPAPFGERATLLQFSTEFCTYCPATRRVLGGIADGIDGVEHIDVDVTTRPDIVDRFALLQTPTTLVLDAGGRIRARIGGAPRTPELLRELDTILGRDHVRNAI